MVLRQSLLRVAHGFDRADAELFQRLENLFAPRVAEMGGEETAIPDNDAEGDHRDLN